MKDREKDLDTERETLRQSRAGLDEMYTQIQKQLKHETRMRMVINYHQMLCNLQSILTKLQLIQDEKCCYRMLKRNFNFSCHLNKN